MIQLSLLIEEWKLFTCILVIFTVKTSKLDIKAIAKFYDSISDV